jgi:hypothetical protein
MNTTLYSMPSDATKPPVLERPPMPTLQQLPPEAQRMVGEMIMVVDEPISIRHRPVRGWKHHHRSAENCSWKISSSSVREQLSHCPAALRINRQLHYDWIALFYAQNEIQLDFDPHVVKCFSKLLPHLGGRSLGHSFVPRSFVFDVSATVGMGELRKFLVGGEEAPWMHKRLPWNHQGACTVKLNTTSWLNEWNDGDDALQHCKEHMQNFFAVLEEMQGEGRLTYTAEARFEVEYWHDDGELDQAVKNCQYCRGLECKVDIGTFRPSRDDFGCCCKTCVKSMADVYLRLELSFVASRKAKRQVDPPGPSRVRG